ncbi:hypothetical protein [Brachybacterium sp.]|uniref:hypothetical protein n=1 Tax=Brachybacterium sp. TaxID=1891286 RepID=UPI002ECFED00
MARGRIKWQLNKKGVAQLLRSPGVRADLQKRADRIATAAGPGVDARVWDGFDRTRARVATTTEEADRNQAQYGTLSRAIDAGKG